MTTLDSCDAVAAGTTPECPIADRLGIAVGETATADELVERLGHDDAWLRSLVTPFDDGGLTRAEVDSVVAEWAENPHWVLEADAELHLLRVDDDTLSVIDDVERLLRDAHHSIDGVSISGRWIESGAVCDLRGVYLASYVRQWVEMAEECGYPAVEEGTSLDGCLSYHGPHTTAEAANLALGRTLTYLGFRDTDDPYETGEYYAVWDAVVARVLSDITLGEALAG